MIVKLHLNNFQSHVKTVVEFHPGVNVFIGLSDSGKSALIRSTDTLLNNGKFYVNWNGKTLGSLIAEFSDTVLKRLHTIKINTKCSKCKTKTEEKICPKCGKVQSDKKETDVFLLGKDEKEIIFSGSSLPDEILNETKIRPIKFVDVEEELQFQRQHSDMFFIGKSYSGPLRNKIISSLMVDAEKVDFVIKKFTKQHDDLKSRHVVIKEELDKKTTHITENKQDIEDLAKLQVQLEEDVKRYDELQRKSFKLTQIKETLADHTRILALTDGIAKLSLAIEQTSSACERMKTIKEKLDRLQTYKVYIDRANKYESFEEISLKPINDAIIKLQTLANTIRQVRNCQNTIDGQNTEIKTAETRIKIIDKQIEDKKTELVEHLKNNGICPLTNERFCQSCVKILSKVE